eukprot:Lithocolla_globosa_v1_NODE_812_length_3242_cov_7.462504.p3 type:complete len:108 gc:universal NODE_812_length_3242_cov_7.462504:1463-1140(-)
MEPETLAVLVESGANAEVAKEVVRYLNQKSGAARTMRRQRNRPGSNRLDLLSQVDQPRRRIGLSPHLFWLAGRHVASFCHGKNGRKGSRTGSRTGSRKKGSRKGGRK